jgi:hypothetical protein
MDENVRDALVEICKLLRRKVTFDIVKRSDKELLDEAATHTALIDLMIARLKSSS